MRVLCLSAYARIRKLCCTSRDVFNNQHPVKEHVAPLLAGKLIQVASQKSLGSPEARAEHIAATLS